MNCLALTQDRIIGHSSQLSGSFSPPFSLRASFKALASGHFPELKDQPSIFQILPQWCISLTFYLYIILKTTPLTFVYLLSYVSSFLFLFYSYCLPTDTQISDCLQRISTCCYLNTELSLPRSFLPSCCIYVYALLLKLNVKFLKVRKIFTVILVFTSSFHPSSSQE